MHGFARPEPLKNKADMEKNVRPLRLALCNATRSWGGVKTWTLEFGRALMERGHTVHILGRSGAFIERAQGMGLPARACRFGPDFNPAAIARFLHFYRAKRIDAVLVNVSQDLRSAGVAARLLGIPLVQRIGMPDDMRPTLKVRLVHRLLKPEYLCPCHFIADGLRKSLPCIPPESVTVIHSAKIPAPEPQQDVRSPLQLATTSQLNPDKGHEMLIPVLAALKNRGYDFIWHVAGTGEQEHMLKTLCERHGLSERTRWYGFTQNVRAVLDACDVFVLPSRTEGLPNTLLEAMGRGLIPVACAVGGVHEAWPPGLEPLLVPGWDSPQPDDPAQSPMGRALAHVLEQDNDTLLSWKHAAWRHCDAHFSLAVQAEKLEQYFARLVARNERNRRAS